MGLWKEQIEIERAKLRRRRLTNEKRHMAYLAFGVRESGIDVSVELCRGKTISD